MAYALTLMLLLTEYFSKTVQSSWPCMTKHVSSFLSFVLQDYSLQIMDAQLEDDADFQCQVGATSQYAGIRIPPQRPFIVGAPTIEVKQGVLKNITCKAQHGKPGASIKWYKDNIRISNDVITRTITFNNKTATSESSVAIIATAGDAGKKIECVAENDALIPPRITLSHNITKNNKIREHQNVRFTCVGTANPFDIKWGDIYRIMGNVRASRVNK
ncbi:hypothetical protein KUTeg_014492 [Tegillarca granosa]|uniref:Ig-like domain-containing protein n=1 Tax=Tegillarca granosa TaxID=220873 RepID=A0ABQ9ERV9_TEGGR|nr:hypothetical protein KUTeg_014492 [Tegillarca granosa]